MQASAAPLAEAAAEDPLLQYVVLRSDLWRSEGWPLGSVVTQGAHAAVAAVWESREREHTSTYCASDRIDHMHKVTLEVKGLAQLTKLSEKLTEASVGHKLWQEQPENVPTALATWPAPKSELTPHFKRLQLCKW